jgi:hypothetical protein
VFGEVSFVDVLMSVKLLFGVVGVSFVDALENVWRVFRVFRA